MHWTLRLSLASVLTLGLCFAQRGGGMGFGGHGGFGGGRGFGGFVGPAPHTATHGGTAFRARFPNIDIKLRQGLGAFQNSAGFSPFFGGLGAFAYPFPYFDGYYGQGQQQPASPMVVVVPYAVAPTPQETYKPETASPVIHEYKENTGGTPASFSIAMKNGSVQSADAVWVMDREVHYVAPDGIAGHVSVDTVDRARTKALNQEKNLTLSLP